MDHVRDGALRTDTEVILDVREHCVEKAARRAHRALVAALLEDEAPSPAAKAELELLARFLRTGDFAALRAENPELAGGADVRARITPNGPRVRLEILREDD